MMLQIRPEGVVHFTPVRVVHIVPESLVHYAQVEVVHYTPVCSISKVSHGEIAEAVALAGQSAMVVYYRMGRER